MSEAGYLFEVALTEYPGHASELAKKALKLGYNTIMSVGGDGTMNEVVNGFFENDRLIDENSRLVVFSRGTGCDFVRSLGIDNSIEAMLVILDRDQKN